METKLVSLTHVTHTAFNAVLSGVVGILLSVNIAAQIPNGVYAITSKLSGKVLEVTNGSTTNGGNVVQMQDRGTDHQRWIVVEISKGVHSLINLSSGKALEVYAFNSNDGANISQYEYWGGDPQLWKIVPESEGYYSLTNKLSHKALTVSNFDSTDGANIEQQSYWGGDPQMWDLRLVSNLGEHSDDRSTIDGKINHWQLRGNLMAQDPSLIFDEGRWWTFQSGTGISVKTSNNGLYWDPMPAVFLDGLSWWKRYVPDQTDLDVWTPDAKAYNGKVWLFYVVRSSSSRASLIGLLSANTINGGDWRDEGLVIHTTETNNFSAIHPDLAIDEYGSPWLVFGSESSGIKLTRLNPMSMKPIGTLFSIANRKGDIAAPTLMYRKGYYYLFVSVTSTDAEPTAQILLGRSSNITGPYLDKDGNNMADGGGSLFETSNEALVNPTSSDIPYTNVIVRQGQDGADGGTAKMYISTLNWDRDGWPKY